MVLLTYQTTNRPFHKENFNRAKCNKHSPGIAMAAVGTALGKSVASKLELVSAETETKGRILLEQQAFVEEVGHTDNSEIVASIVLIDD